MRIKIAVSLIAAVFCCTSAYAGQVAVERLNYRIVTPDNPGKIHKLAASELGKILEKTYSEAIKLNGSDAPVVFYVGVSGEAIMSGFTDLPEIYGKFGVFRKTRNILFYGWDDKDIDPERESYGEAGTLLSVYYFLSKYVGTGFYFPGETGYSVTKNKEIKFKAEKEMPRPSYLLRGFSLMTKEYTAQELNIFFRRSLCSIPRWGHKDNYYIYMDNWKKRFWDTHPEYFMMKDGKRISEKYPNHVPCFSNPEVIKQTVADIIEDLNRNPSKTTVRLFCDAPINLCDCEKCKEMEERKYTGEGERACEAVYGFQKKVADLLHQTHPDIYFMTQTKGTSYYQPPKLVKLGSLFTVEVMTNMHSTKLMDLEAGIKSAIEWRNAGVRTFLMGYPRYDDIPTKNMPVITPQFYSEYLNAFKGLTYGADRTELRFNPYSFSALNQFVFARTLFDVDADVDELIKEFCTFAYPGAEKYMRKFYKEMEELYRQRKSVHSDPLSDIYYYDNLEKPMEYLNDAKENLKEKSVFFDKLHDDFTAFYKRSGEEKRKVDESREKNKKKRDELDKLTGKTLKIPYMDIPWDAVETDARFEGALKLDFSTMAYYNDFQEARAYLACDKKYLYIWLVAREAKMPDIVNKCAENNKGPIWSDDSFEIMLVPPKTEKYYQVIVNSLGTYRGFARVKGKNNSEDAPEFKIEVKPEVLSDRWRLKVKIPLAQFGDADFGRDWLFDIFRNRNCGGKVQMSGIRLLGDSYHKVDEYCRVSWPEQLEK